MDRATSTSSSSRGLFSPRINPTRANLPSLSDGTPLSSPYLHPLQMHKVKDTNEVLIEQDFLTGRKLINQYEILNEIGRGVYGKVKLARDLNTGEFVAIKIIQRFSKKRKLGRVTVSPEDKTKREIAILKKIRHSNVVGLIEVIDVPDLKKIYMILEHVELGEIVWRKKGDKNICHYERRRIEREQRGEMETGEDEKYFQMIERKRQQKDAKQAKIAQANAANHAEYWSLEHGDDDEDATASLSRQTTHDSLTNFARSMRSSYRSNPGSRIHSRAASRAPSLASSRAHTPLPIEFDIGALDSDNEDETPMDDGAHQGTYYGSYQEEAQNRGRSPSATDSVISHMSSMDGMQHDAFEDDFSYVPCFTFDQARSAFRDTVLGLEYLHYEGIVHRDIKPANLLWTRDHRVKISDFGVSYFGRPIRDGEQEENISEADALDFDNDLELAKTVGTPAFFAPELCYTDVDVEQPRITEQIDVWSLGVTLYCLIFARIPFLADDEYQLFRCIAKEDVYIPRRRLKAVDPNYVLSSLGSEKPTRPSNSPYRDEGELAFEEIDDELHDLLRRMLIKDPSDRIKLREVKRHPWVIKGIDNVIGWLDDTDPSRRTAGRRIEVDSEELDHAVTFLERARSAVKKVVGKVIGRSETRSEGSRRRRAISNATSSGTDLHNNPPLTPISRDGRRGSLRCDDSYFEDTYHHPQQHHEHVSHPLAQTLIASPDVSQRSGGVSSAQDLAQPPPPVGIAPTMPSDTMTEPDRRPGPPDRANSTAASIQTIVHRGHSHSRSMNSQNRDSLDEVHEVGPFTDHVGNLFGGHLWTSSRDRDSMANIEERRLSHAHPETSLFESDCKHSEASVAMSGATATGKFKQSYLPTLDTKKTPQASIRSSEVSPTGGLPSSSAFLHFRTGSTFSQSFSTPNMPQSALAASNLEERPSTANRTPEAKTPAPRNYESTPDSFKRAKEIFDRRRLIEAEAERERQQKMTHMAADQPCPSSPDDDIFLMKSEEAARRAESYSSVNSVGLTSPSDFDSPISSANLGSTEQFYPSVPSLPALVSGASSVCADLEEEMLQRPGFPQQSDHGFTGQSTPDSVTPPALSTHNSTNMSEEEDDGYNGDGDTTHTLYEESDSDSDDDCLTMGKRKPVKKSPVADRSSFRKLERKNTNNSIRSTETAKMVEMER